MSVVNYYVGRSFYWEFDTEDMHRVYEVLRQDADDYVRVATSKASRINRFGVRTCVALS